MITLTPLSASAASHSPSEPVCYLLEVDGARILLDLGQGDLRASSKRTSWEYEEQVRELAPTLSLVLLSHSSTPYLSLYPYARARWGLQCPVYATQPTVEMGRVVCLTEVESWRGELPADPQQSTATDVVKMEVDVSPNGIDTHRLKGPFVATVEEVHEAFDWVKAIRYNQPLHLGGDLSHLLLTPFPSGHTLGGTLYKIRSPTSGTVLYAVGINHTGERHLDGMVGGQGGASGYADGVMRPDLLIIEAGRSEIANVKRRNREEALLKLVTTTLESNHSLLFPTDPSPRLLELLILLDQHWSFRLAQPRGKLSPAHDVWPYPLCLVSKTGQDMASFARSLIEWMGGVIRDSGGAEVEEGRNHGRKRKAGAGVLGSEYGALDFRHVRFFSSPSELLQAYPLTRPKLVIAIPPSMSHGPSRFLFTTIAGMQGNVIVLTSRSEEGTLARDLYDTWQSRQAQGVEWGRSKIGIPLSVPQILQIEMNSKVPLSGDELATHLETERLAKEKEAAQTAAIDRSRRMLEADDLDSDSDTSEGNSEIDPTEPNPVANLHRAERGDDEPMQMSFDIYVKGQQMRDGGVGELGRFRMFPFIERRGRKVDSFGEGIDVGLWVRRGREIEEEGETEEVREAKRRKIEDDEKQLVPPEPPSKFVSELHEINVQASVFYVDMEGLHDGQALKTIISDLQPRKIILVRSSDQATQSLIKFFNTTSITRDVYTPSTGEIVKIGEHVASYSIMLGDSISGSLGSKWSKFEGYEVVMVDGKIAFSAGSTVPVIESSAFILPEAPKEEKPDEDVTSEPAVKTEPDLDSSIPKSPSPVPIPVVAKPPYKPSPLPLPGSLFVGDLRLPLLKARLAAKSIPAEFAGQGVLICGPGIHQGEEAKGGSIVAVRKAEDGRVSVEGGIGKVWEEVRKEVMGCFARVVAA